MGSEIVQIERRDSIVSGLQEQGSKQFALQIANQRSQLMEILKEFGKCSICMKRMVFFSLQIIRSDSDDDLIFGFFSHILQI